MEIKSQCLLERALISMRAFIKKLAFLSFLFWCVSISGNSQQVPSYNYTTVDGLPNNAIRSLFVDSRGIVWIGTENGLSKFENGRFKNFFETDGLAFNSCWAIAEDKNGNLWFGSYGGGISVFDGKKFRVFTQKDGLADNRIRHFYPYEDKMLIGTEDGVSVADLQTFQITSIPSTIRGNDLNYTAGFFEYENKIFYSTYRSGSFELRLKGGSYEAVKVNDWLPIYSFFTKENQLFLSDKGSIQQLSIDQFLQGEKPTQSFGQSIVWGHLNGVNQEDYLIAASLFSKDGGVFLLDKGQMKDVGEWLGVDSKFILAGAVNQKRKMLYLGSQDKGLYQIRLDDVITYNSFEEREVKGIAGDGDILAILSQDGLQIQKKEGSFAEVYSKDFKKVQSEFYQKFPHKIPKHLDGFFELDPAIPAEEIEYYEVHKEGESWWVNTNVGIFEMSLEGRIRTYLPVHAYSIGFTPDGLLLETNPYAGVRIYSNPGNFEYTYFEPELSNTPLQIAKVVKGDQRTYLASVFHGLYHWDGQSFFSYKNEGLWKESKFKTMHSLGNGILLLGTEFGDLYQVQVHPKFEILKKWPKEDLLGSSILFIEEYKGVIFIGTELGLHILEEGELRFWSEEKGVFNRIFKTAKRIEDKLYVGLDEGYYIINLPELIAKEYPPIELVITDLKINGKAIDQENFRWFAYQNSRLNLGAEENSLSIRFQPKANLSNGRLRYHYRIKPGAEWTEFSEDALIELPYLPAGSYQLEVEVQDLFSGKITSNQLLRFDIARPYYLQWWFFLLMTVLLSGIFFVIYKVRLNQIRSESSLKQRIVEIKLEALQSQMNPHFIFNAINSIQYYILKKETKQALSYLGKFSKLIRSTLDQSSQALITLEDEINYLRQYIEVENIRMDNRVKWSIEGDALERKQDLKIPPMIIQPLVENVFNHAFSVDHPNPELLVQYEILSKNQILCTVKDNGEGIKAKKGSSHQSKGMEMIREKLSLLPGYTEQSVEFVSSKKDTEVRVIIFCG